MNLRRVVLVLSICLLVSSVVAHRRKRAVWHFRSMIKCTIPNSLPLLDYGDYGCFCGKGGGGTPVDDLDRCCEVHDKCYGDALQHHACWPLIHNPYTKRYRYKCDEATKIVTCPSDLNDKCGQFVCDCDRKAAICFASAGYNEENRDLPIDRCQ